MPLYSTNDDKADPAVTPRSPESVPLTTLEASIFFKASIPEPENTEAVTTFALKDPEASLATMVEAPFADAAVVLAFAKVPDETLEALSAVKSAPEPENVVAVIRLALKDPEASLATMVEAPFELDAVVLAFAKVPVVILEAFVVSVVADVAKPVTCPDVIDILTFAADVALP